MKSVQKYEKLNDMLITLLMNDTMNLKLSAAHKVNLHKKWKHVTTFTT